MNNTCDQLVRLNLGVVPEAAVSGGLLVQTETNAYLMFNAMRVVNGGRRVDAGTAVLKFKSAILTKFGLPNDEAVRGHPILGQPGSDLAYEIVEVLNSSWRDEIERQSQQVFPSTNLSRFRHFAVLMHDSTFECLAADITAEVSTEPYAVVLEKVASRALEDPR